MTSRSNEPPGLRDLQMLLYRLVTAPSGVNEGLRETGIEGDALGGLIRGDERLGAIDRVEIYAGMYFHRLMGVLQEDFPATLAVLGSDAFHNLVTDYLLEYPPRYPSVFHVGDRLGEFLALHPIRDRSFVHELARLERMLLEVFHAPEATPLDASAMRAIAPPHWPAVRMRTHPATAILDFQWEVSEVLRAVSDGEEWKQPEHCGETVLVWRTNDDVSYRRIDTAECRALRAAADGATFGAICEAAAAALHADADPAATINAMLARWLDGVLVRD